LAFASSSASTTSALGTTVVLIVSSFAGMASRGNLSDEAIDGNEAARARNSRWE
jgi:hypothetical protein